MQNLPEDFNTLLYNLNLKCHYVQHFICLFLFEAVNMITEEMKQRGLGGTHGEISSIDRDKLSVNGQDYSGFLNDSVEPRD